MIQNFIIPKNRDKTDSIRMKYLKELNMFTPLNKSIYFKLCLKFICFLELI